MELIKEDELLNLLLMLLSRMWSRSKAWPSLGGEFLLWKFSFLSPGDNVCLHIFLWVTCCGLSWGNSYYLTHRAPTCLLVLMLALHYPYQQKAGVKSDSLKMSMLYGYIMDMLLAHCLCWLVFKYRIPPGVFWLTPQSTICKILSFAMSAGAPRPLQSPTRFQAKLQLWISTNQQNNT